jgi:hypothetical protein
MKELFEYLALKEITPNALYILWCAATKTKSSLKTSVIHTELRVLVNDDLLDASYGVTTKGMAILNNIPGITGSMTVAQEDAEDSIIKFLNIFPKGKLPSGKPARVNRKNIEESFKWFFKNYTYDWDTILRATWYYIETYEKANYMYMKNSQYFIRKQNTDKSWDSELANYCEIIINGDDEPESPHFTDKVV